MGNLSSNLLLSILSLLYYKVFWFVEFKNIQSICDQESRFISAEELMVFWKYLNWNLVIFNTERMKILDKSLGNRTGLNICNILLFSGLLSLPENLFYLLNFRFTPSTFQHRLLFIHLVLNNLTLENSSYVLRFYQQARHIKLGSAGSRWGKFIGIQELNISNHL